MSAYDNRRYTFSGPQITMRGEYTNIREMVQPGSKIIDYGCGNGSLLAYLVESKNCQGTGIEIVPSGVALAKEKGLTVFQGSIDEPWEQFHKDEFDYAICNVTIQMVMFPEVLIQEMSRVARYQIISFPNFANIKNRFDLLFRGRMPKPMLYGHEWYSTGHIHQLSNRDFLEFIKKSQLQVKDFQISSAMKAPWKRYLAHRFPNLFASTCIYLLERTETNS